MMTGASRRGECRKAPVYGWAGDDFRSSVYSLKSCPSLKKKQKKKNNFLFFFFWRRRRQFGDFQSHLRAHPPRRGAVRGPEVISAPPPVSLLTQLQGSLQQVRGTRSASSPKKEPNMITHTRVHLQTLVLLFFTGKHINKNGKMSNVLFVCRMSHTMDAPAQALLVSREPPL